jgi:hypothetical protein
MNRKGGMSGKIRLPFSPNFPAFLFPVVFGCGSAAVGLSAAMVILN